MPEEIGKTSPGIPHINSMTRMKQEDGERVELSKIPDISWDEHGLRLLLSFPPPETAGCEHLSFAQAVKVQNALYALWRRLLLSNEPLPISEYVWECKHGHRNVIKGNDLRGRLFLSVSGYFQTIFTLHFTKGKARAHGLPEYFVLKAIEQLIPDKTDLASDMDMVNLRIVSFEYFTALSCLYFIHMFRETPLPSSLIAPFESIYHGSVKGLHQMEFAFKGGNERIAVRRLLRGILTYATMVYEDLARWVPKHKLAAFSAIRLDELSGLADRNPVLCSRYGEKCIERVFERQLSLVFQSFGLYVTSSSAGQSTVDLVCISANPKDHLSFLVDAKTSKRPYSLPRKDFRAIKDYVSDMQRCLASFPPLGFVLIVGQDPARTMTGKLRLLEMECGLPVRFLKASYLAELREQLPGPLPLGTFSSAVMKGPHVLPQDLVSMVAGSAMGEQRAHQSFVRAMLSAKGIIATDHIHEWAEDPHDPPSSPIVKRKQESSSPRKGEI